MDLVNITIRLMNVSVESDQDLTEDECRKLVSERVMATLSEEPLAQGAYVSRFDLQVEAAADKEAGFLTEVVDGFSRLDDSSRRRVLAYLTSRFGGV